MRCVKQTMLQRESSRPVRHRMDNAQRTAHALPLEELKLQH